MSVKTDRWILEQAQQNRMIHPFVERSVSKNVVSYGLSHLGYDFRLDDTFWVPREDKEDGVVLWPKAVPSDHYDERRVPEFCLFPGQTVLGKSLEYFQMPNDVLGIVYGKSTYARCGILLNMTPIEPGWCGFMTMAISNVGRDAVVLRAYEGIGQIVFHQAEEVPLTTYATKEGKYQNAQGIQIARVED